MRLTVDIIVLCKNKIVLIRRKKPPFMDCLVLPGGHVEDSDANLAAACCRELAEEIGLEVAPDQLRLLTVRDAKDRDPRPERRVSIVFMVRFTELPSLIAGSDALEVEVVDLDSISQVIIGFDHYQAIMAAVMSENVSSSFDPKN